MNRKEANNQFKALHYAILRTHSELLKKRENMNELNKRMNIFMSVDMINPEDMAQYMLARSEAHDAHEKWRTAQRRYFKFIENKKAVL